MWFWRTFRDADGQVVLQYGPCRGWLARRALVVPGCGVARRSFQADSVFHRGVASSRTDSLCLGQEYPLAQEVGFRASVHRHLELLDAVDGAFDRAGVVLQGQPGDHGVQVTAQPGGERVQRR